MRIPQVRNSNTALSFYEAQIAQNFVQPCGYDAESPLAEQEFWQRVSFLTSLLYCEVWKKSQKNHLNEFISLMLTIHLFDLLITNFKFAPSELFALKP